jgi:hypothetical protein
MILKVQLPLEPNAEPKALLYNKTLDFVMLHGITDHIREKMAGRPKAFFDVNLSQGEPILLDEVPDQGW